MTEALLAAQRYSLGGLAVISIRSDGSKAPAITSWSQYQKRAPTSDEIHAMFGNGGLVGIGIIAGRVSGNLEILDFDKPGIFDEWREQIRQLSASAYSIVSGLPLVFTPDGGRHLYYRCSEISGSQKLAVCMTPFVGGKTNKRKTVAIETKGEGGYVLAPGSPPGCHDAGVEYQGAINLPVPEISPDVRELMLRVARGFDERGADDGRETDSRNGGGNGHRPGEDYNDSISWADVLEPHGWTRVRTCGEVTYWRRPGKDHGISATTGRCGDRLYVFTTNAGPLDANRSYDKFGVFARLSHDGDFSAATRAISPSVVATRETRRSSTKTRSKSATSPPQRENRDSRSSSVKYAIPDAPVDASNLVPPGWSLQDESEDSPALYRIVAAESGTSRTPISHDPIVISAWITNETTHTKGLELAWKALGKWHSVVVDRASALDTSKSVAALANSGFPISSSNKKRILDYLVAYLDLNRRKIPVRAVSEQMGWQIDGSFLAGKNRIGDGATEFLAADSGETQFADAIESRGSLDGWTEAVKPLADYPRVMIALYASLATPLLEILQAPNFAIDWAYQTSSGKTTTLRVAASVWGCPDDRSGKSMIASWDSTQVWIERTASARSHLPLIIDDTKRAAKIRGESIVPKTVYAIANGQGRGRGSVKGTSQMRYWRTILLSTGESSIVDMSKDGGAAARILTLWGSPFGGDSNEISSLIRKLNHGLLANYGHAGPALVRWIIGAKHEWQIWRKQLIDISSDYSDRMLSSGIRGIASRLADNLATLELAGRIAHRALDLPWEYRSPVNDVIDGITSGVDMEDPQQSDRAAEALQSAYDWAMSRRGQFWSESQGGDAEMPQGGWLGRWDRDDLGLLPKAQFIGYLRDPLIAHLSRVGYDATSVIKLWRDRGWLQSGNNRVTTKPVKVWDKQLVRLVCVDLSAIVC